MTVWLLKSILASQWSFEPTQFSSELDHVGPFLQVWLRKENLIQVKGQCFTCKWSCWPDLVALLVTTHPISSYGVYWSRYELFWVSQVSWRVSAKEMPLCSISIQFSPHVPPSLLHNWYCIPMCMAVNDEHGQLRCLRMHHCDPLEHIWISEWVHKGLHSVYARMLMLTHLFRQMLNNWTGLQLYHFGNLWMHGTEISWDARNLDILMAGDAKTQRVKDLGPGTIEMCCDLKWKTRQRASPYEGRMLSPCLLRNHNDFCEPANQRHESKKSLCPWWFLELFELPDHSRFSNSHRNLHQMISYDFMVISRILFQAPTPSYAADLDELIWIPRTRGVRSTWGGNSEDATSPWKQEDVLY